MTPAMRNLMAGACLGSMLASPMPAAACGACIEDQVAATYDHAVVIRAAARHHVVVFAAIEGSGNAQMLARQVKAAAERTPGVDRASVRTAVDPSALSFAVDPSVAAPEATLAAIEKGTRAVQVKLPVLRIVR